jgi:hypothetical protein
VTSAAVLIPWRSTGCPYRDDAWARVEAQWLGYGWPLIVADDGGDPFARGASVNLAATQIDADVYVIADADTLISPDQVEEAVELAVGAPGLVVAFDRYLYLRENGRVKFFMEHTVSSCVAVSHRTWELAGGFDGRFRAWGYEDAAFEAACSTLAGPTRWVHGDVRHIWHPIETNRPDLNRALVRPYIEATGDPSAMRALIDSRQESHA